MVLIKQKQSPKRKRRMLQQRKFCYSKHMTISKETFQNHKWWVKYTCYKLERLKHRGSAGKSYHKKEQDEKVKHSTNMSCAAQVCHISKSRDMTGSWKEPKDEVPSDWTAHCCQKRKELRFLLFPNTLFHHLPILFSSGPPWPGLNH